MLRAQNEGEGGVFALYGLLHDRSNKTARLVLWSLMLGAGLLLGDGMITPAISVLSAVEGLHVASPVLGHIAIMSLTVRCCWALFSIQSRGASGVGRIFGPIVLAWFAVIAALGLRQVAGHPEILAAFNPVHGLRFLSRRTGWKNSKSSARSCWSSPAARRCTPISAISARRRSASAGSRWSSRRCCSIIWGRGAICCRGAPVRQGLLFYSMTPQAALYPMVALATAATVIASQSLISGAFSLVSQAIRLGLFPRIALTHTHARHAGQIYAPFVNWALFFGCVALVLGFGSASALAAAYGLAVSGVMVITSLAMFLIARRYWGWSRTATALVWGALTAVSGGFFVASTLKFFDGGFIPMLVGVGDLRGDGDLALGPQGDFRRL